MKTKKTRKKRQKPTPEQTLEFLNDYHNLINNKNLPTQSITLEIPKNILNMTKVISEQLGVHYQPQIVQIIKDWIINYGRVENDKSNLSPKMASESKS